MNSLTQTSNSELEMISWLSLVERLMELGSVHSYSAHTGEEFENFGEVGSGIRQVCILGDTFWLTDLEILLGLW